MKAPFLHILIIWVSCISAAFGQANKKLVKINTVASYVEIHGTTNVNSFNCNYNASLPEDQFEVSFSKKGDDMEINHQALFLKVTNFKCPSPQMTADFHDLLAYEDYPYIIFQLKKITAKNTAHIMIEMAGEQQAYQVQIENSIRNNILSSTAQMTLCITDFGLEAPEKFFGMVKVNENIEVEFKIEMNLYDN